MKLGGRMSLDGDIQYVFLDASSVDELIHSGLSFKVF